MYHPFGPLLVRSRKIHDVSAKELAERIHVDPSYVTQWERGRRDPPKQSHLDNIIQALGLTQGEADALMQG